MSSETTGPARRPRYLAPLLAGAWGVLVAAPAALAVQPETWTHTSEADFEPGDAERTVVTSLGEIKLAADLEQLGGLPDEVSVVHDIERLPDGTVYVAAGPEAVLLRRVGDGFEEVVALEGEQVFALGQHAGKLLVAISGEPSRLAVLDGEELSVLTELPGVRYVWDVAQLDSRLAVATGLEGRVLLIDPDRLGGEAAEGEAAGVSTLLDADQANVLCLAVDGRGRLLAGTDTDGIVYRLTLNESGEVAERFVLYDAAEPEIGALLVGADGAVYAGTADADQARPGRLEDAVSEPTGRPDGGPMEPDAEEAPGPGDLPNVPPGEEPVEAADLPEPPADEAPESADPDAAPAEDPGRAPDAPDTPGASDQPDGDTQAAAEAEPTPEQRDRLRELVRERLEAARRSGRMQQGFPPSAARGGSGSGGGGSRVRPAASSQAAREGNAIYRIDPQGFVREVFRESVMILRLAESDGRLLVATGNQGQVFTVDVDAGETAVLLDLESEQIPAMLPLDGRVLLGAANPAALHELGRGIAPSGHYTSPVLDASQISLWGRLNLTVAIPQGASVAVETRSSNIGDPEIDFWSPWSQAQSFLPRPGVSELQPREMDIASPPARFLQYRLTLTSDGASGPAVDRLDLTYVTPNLPPRLTTLSASYPEPRGNTRDAELPTAMKVEWEAEDPNGDQLRYRLEYQIAGSDRWLLIEDELDEPSYEWETRRVPDGRYLLRVTASDRMDNPGDMAQTAYRRSDPVLVDHTRPALRNLSTAAAPGRLTISGEAVDELSTIRSISYTVNAEDPPQPVLPDDLIFDSTTERFEVTLPDLSPGPHVVTLVVRDARGNRLYHPVLVEIPGR